MAGKLLILICAVSLIFFPFSAWAGETFPNDPDYSKQWYLPAINAPAAWGITIGSAETVVAVLDTGVEVVHPDLFENIWNNPEEIPFNNFDDDHNGYIDDIYGWNFIDNQPNPGPDLTSSGAPSALQHGTLVAGLIGAAGNNGTDGVGVNWRVKIMSLRVLDSEGTGNSLDVARAIDYAVQEHAQVINMSFIGVNPGPELKEAISRAQMAGVILVAAAGNDDNALLGGDLDFSPQFPVCYDGPDGARWGVIGVAALDKENRKAPFSDYGVNCVDLAAPGIQLPSTLVYQPGREGFQTSFGGRWSGTSLAAPLVSGAVALLKSLKPNLTPGEVYEILTKSADDISAQNLFYLGELGAGKLNIGAAAALLKKLYPEVGGGFVNFSQPLPIQELLVYRPVKNKPKFFDGNGEEKKYQGEIKVFSRRLLPKKVLKFYNKYKGQLATAQGDIDGDWEKEFVTVKPGLNPVALVWSEQGIKKGEIKIKGDYRKGIGLIIK